MNTCSRCQKNALIAPLERARGYCIHCPNVIRPGQTACGTCGGRGATEQGETCTRCAFCGGGGVVQANGQPLAGEKAKRARKQTVASVGEAA
jgi:hypothetical protein